MSIEERMSDCVKYKKKPVVIEAFQYDGDLMNSKGEYYVPDWAKKAFEEETLFYQECELNHAPCELFIKTLEGSMLANVGDYIIQGIQGELYPCKPDIFEATYEAVD